MKSLTYIRGAALVGALTLLHASGALAAGSAGSGENTPLHLSGSGTPAPISTGNSSWVRTIVGMFIVIAVIYGVYWILRQVKTRGQRPSGHGLEQLASLPLASGKSVALVRAGSEILLVGVADHAVTPIRTYTEEEAIELGLELPLEHADEPGAPGAGGMARLADALRRMTVRS